MLNNAGTMPLAFYADHANAREAWERCIDINIKGVLYGMLAVHDTMIAQGRGHVINVSSIYGNYPVVGAGVYGATKAALNLLSEGLRSELTGTNVHLTVIYPGAIGTNIAANSGLDMSGAAEASTRKVVAPKNAGAAIVRAITKDEKRILIGQDASIMWHANHLSPDLAATLIYHGMKDLLPPA